MKFGLGQFCTVWAFSALMLSSAADAAVRDRQIDAARMCTKHFPKYERIHGIPTHLLAAVSSVESGRWNDTVNMALPWPWTINANGKGYYLNSKAEAVRKAKALMLQGIRSIDVGCMQVNLKHHPKAFVTLNDAFDPKKNVAYAAKFLRSNYDDTRSWTRATATYHSKTPKYGKKYLARIENVWSKIVGRVRKARTKRGLAQGEYAVDVANRQYEQQFAALEQEFANIDDYIPTIKPEPVVAKAETPKDTRNAEKAAAEPKKPRASMRIIEVSNRTARQQRQNVMVIRPQIADSSSEEAVADDQTQRVASVRQDFFVMNGSYQNQVPVTRSAPAPKRSSDSTSLRRPNFVFVD